MEKQTVIFTNKLIEEVEITDIKALEKLIGGPMMILNLSKEIVMIADINQTDRKLNKVASSMFGENVYGTAVVIPIQEFSDLELASLKR